MPIRPLRDGGPYPETFWAEIPGFSRYAVSNYGEIYNKITKKTMRFSIANYRHVLKASLIDDEGVRRTLGVAPIVATAFVDRPNHRCTVVIQLDGDSTHVAAHNLAWRAPRTAYLYARQQSEQRPMPWTNLPVRNLNTGAEYSSIIECGRIEGVVWKEVWESVNTAIFSPESRRRVPPYGHTYEVIKGVQGRVSNI